MKKMIALLLAVLLTVSCTGALAAKNPKINADDLNFEAIIDTLLLVVRKIQYSYT